MSPKFLCRVALAVPLGVITLFARSCFVHPDAQAQAVQKTPRPSVAAVVEAGNRFAFDLYQRERRKEGNLFFSPASISAALAMGYVGAAENTAAEMAKSLHLDMPKEQLNSEMRALLASWKTFDPRQGFRLEVANRLWGQQRFSFLPDYLRVTRDDYGAELARIDLRQAEAARQTINKWVEQQTHEKIQDLIASPDVLRDADLVLTNAAYFKGDWQSQFRRFLTTDDDFHISPTRQVNIPLMHQIHKFRYAAVDGLQLLDLPYGDSSLSMIVILPERPDGLPELEAKLSAASLQKWTQSARAVDVEVSLPKFKMTATFALADTLTAMGMPSAFDPATADFSGMTGRKELFFAAAIHKAFVDVHEEGTEAAAATGFLALTATVAMPIELPVFRADHPFVFLIRDNRNGAILFLGRVVDPTK
jgi:serpin B